MGAPTNRPVGSEQLQQIAQRIDNLLDQKEELAEDMKQLKAEVKGRGYDTPALWKLVVDRRKDQQKLAEAQEIRELYAAALGYDVFG